MSEEDAGGLMELAKGVQTPPETFCICTNTLEKSMNQFLPRAVRAL